MSDTVASRPRRWLFHCWKILKRTVMKYIETDGELRAASFAYYAFFALFPLMLLFVSIGSWVVSGSEEEVTTTILSVVDQYIPVSDDGENVIALTIQGVVKSRGAAGVVALLALTWSALRFFQALVQGINHAWGMEAYSWWRLPLANMAMMGITASTLFLGVLAPVVLKAIERYWQHFGVYGYEVLSFSLSMVRLVMPSIILFYGLLMFYKYAPRRKTKFSEVVWAAVVVTIGLQLLSKGFVIYADNFGRFNRLYGTLSSVVAVMMWIYLSGSVLIFGSCLSAAQAEEKAERLAKGA
ncbi:MAG TPA: YihY/virulence factor BrkB family protein [Chthoniobacteraceae bacterium]|nr:YihY/virulence factor BrkB family protein [Chthoniobacteraceae bacterium]